MLRSMLLALLALLCVAAQAQSVEFAYSGRVRSGGQPFTGLGSFKFAIVSADGNYTLWANDGVTLTGDEPTSSVQVQVVGGYFSLSIGDETLTGMAPLDPAAFTTEERVFLRVWFSDGESGFSLLTPDRPISNPSVIGQQNPRPLTIFVNPLTGNDRNSGTRPNRAKKTIQAAWNAIPPRVLKDVEVRLAPGEYYQSAVLSGKQVLNQALITVRGDAATSSAVIVSGALNHATSTTVVRENVLKVIDQRGLKITNLTLENAKGAALSATAMSDLEVTDCRLQHSYFGLQFTQYTRAIVDDILAVNNGTPIMVYGVMVENAYLELSNAQLLGPGNSVSWNPSLPFAVLVNFNGVAWIQNVAIDNWTAGIHTKFSSTVNCMRGGNSISHCQYGIYAIHNSNVGAGLPADGRVTYSNITSSETYAATGAIFGN